MTLPPAEAVITPELVVELLRAQHPDLAALPLRFLEEGFDNALYRLGEDFLVRVPRRAVAGEAILAEQRWLPSIAPTLPLSVPAPVRLGRPTSYYPWAWSVVPWFAGETGENVVAPDMDLSAARLGQFLRALHVEAPPGAPHNLWRSVSLAERRRDFYERAAMIADLVDVDVAARFFELAVDAGEPPTPARLIHGDLHPGNVVFRDGVLSAIVDFSDLCAGDVATDLSGAWLLLPLASADIFLRSYGETDDTALVRARGWAAFFGVMFVSIGRDVRPSYERIGRHALTRLAAECGEL